MKKIYVLIIALLAQYCALAAGFNVSVVRTTQWQSSVPGYLTDALVELTPKGLYCEVAITFSINAPQGNYSPSDSLEGIINFDVPANSYMQDSYLWLDNNVVIRAAVIEKTKAIQIYESIVRRRKDPSILVKTGPNSYQLNVYPMTINFPRKMKIVYSVPFEWLQNKLCVAVPIDIFRASQTRPVISLKVNCDNVCAAPYFIEAAFSPLVNSHSGNHYSLKLDPVVYQNIPELNLVYNTNISNGIFLGTYPLNANEGIYQLGINPAISTTYTPRNVVLIVDHAQNANQFIFSPGILKYYLKTFLLKNYNEKDSFNLFYTWGNVVSAFTSWHGVDSASVIAAVDAIPETNQYQSYLFEQLLEQGIGFSERKPGSNTQSVLFTVNSDIYIPATVDITMTHLRNYLNGSFTNKVQIVNNTTAITRTGANTYVGSEPFYNRLARESGGSVYINPKLNIKEVLSNINRQNSYHTSSYKITLPLSAGYTYNEYDILGINRFNAATGYMETGKYTGTMGNTPITVQMMTGTGINTLSATPSALYTGDDNFAKTWVNKYMIDMLAQNTGQYTREILDSSINNRVLCDSTAFLALETGDTVKISKTQAISGGVILNVNGTAKDFAKLYPNPFADVLNIDCSEDITAFEVYDITGRKVYAIQIPATTKNLIYNGKTSDGAALLPGVYTIIIHSATQKQVYKINKL